MKKLFIFDLDGTLADTQPLLNFIFADALTECGLHLVAIVVGLLHSDYFIYVMITSKQLYNLNLLEAELSLIRQILQLAPTALFIIGTFNMLCHSYNSVQ